MPLTNQGSLVLEGKTGKEIPKSSRLEFLEKFSANNFALSDAEDNTSRTLNGEGIADLFYSIGNSPKVTRAKFVGSRLSELYFRFRRFVLLVQTKKVISMNYGSSTSS